MKQGLMIISILSALYIAPPLVAAEHNEQPDNDTVIKRNIKNIKWLYRRIMQLEKKIEQQLIGDSINSVPPPRATFDKSSSNNLDVSNEGELLLHHSNQLQILLKRLMDLENKLKGTASASDSSIGKGAVDDTIDSSEIAQVEETVFALSEQIGSGSIVNSFDSKNLTIGGFLHQTYTSVDGEAGSASAFNRQVFELLLKTDFNARWSGFMASVFSKQSGINYRDPGQRTDPFFDINDNTGLVIGWANYSRSNKLNLRMGRYITPQGITNIEHFPASLLDPEQPQFLRPFGGETMFPNFLDGLMLHGNIYPSMESDTAIEYALFTGNYVENGDELVNGGRLAVDFNNGGVVLGINVLNGQRADPLLHDYSVIGWDMTVDYRRFYWKTEAFSSDEDTGPDREAFYTQPALRISPKWVGFLRYDVLEIAQFGADNEEITETMFGVNYLPYPNTRLRATYSQRSYEQSTFGFAEADVDILQLSATFSF